MPELADGPPAARRPYAEVTVAPAAAGYRVLLDQRPVLTPLRLELVLETAALAEAVAGEWRAQGGRVDPATMPLTRMAATAVDKVADARPAVVEEMLRYLDTELLCYRVEDPPELARLQTRQWQPLLDWLGDRHGVRLEVTSGLMPVTQSPASRWILESHLSTLSPLHLATAAVAAATGGSLVIALALTEGRIGAGEAFTAAQLEALHQMRQWGEEEQALARHAAIRAEFELCERIVSLCGWSRPPAARSFPS